MKINYRAVKVYLHGKLKEEREFAKTRTEAIDLEQSKEAIESLEKAMENPELQEIIKKWNQLIDEMTNIKHKAGNIDYYLGKYFEHKM
jgi:hypothetical protein